MKQMKRVPLDRPVTDYAGIEDQADTRVTGVGEVFTATTTMISSEETIRLGDSE
jgi:hypothetical protein